MLKSKFLARKYLEPIFLYVFAFFYFSNFVKYAHVSIYQGRDIQRALDLLNGQFIWYGPDLTGGGHTPGPFYYYLLAIPLSIFGTWQSALWFEILLVSGASVVLWHMVKTYHDSFAAIAVYFLFLASSIFFVCIVQFWNPSFLFFFQAVLLYVFYDYNKIGTRRLLFGGFLLGLTLQIHYQQAVFLVGILAVIASNRKKTVRERLYALSIFGAAVVLPLIPHFLFRQAPEGTYYSLRAGMEALWFTAENVSGLENHHKLNLSERLFGFINVFKDEINFIVLTGLWFFAAWRAVGRKVRTFEINRFVVLTAVVAFFLVLPNIYQRVYLRYAMPFLLCFYVLSAPMLSWIHRSFPQKASIGLAIGVGIFIGKNFWAEIPDGLQLVYQVFFIGLAGIAVFYFSTPKNRVVTFLLMTVLVWSFRVSLSGNVVVQDGYARDPERREILAKTLAQETGWTWEHLRERSFILGDLPEEDLRIMYRQNLSNQNTSAPKNYDGILIVYDWDTRVLGERPGAEFNWYRLEGIIPPEIFEAAIAKKLECKKAIRAADYQICFYEFSDSSLHLTWNNFGYPYQFKQPLLYPISNSTGGRRTSEDTWDFYWNPCENLEPSCTVYFSIKKLEGNVAVVTVLGDPVSVPEDVMNPAWTVSLENLTLETKCGRKTFAHPVASILGYTRRNQIYRLPTFLGPFQNLVPFECPNPSELTFSSTIVQSMSKAKPFPIKYPVISWKSP